MVGDGAGSGAVTIKATLPFFLLINFYLSSQLDSLLSLFFFNPSGKRKWIRGD